MPCGRTTPTITQILLSSRHSYQAQHHELNQPALSLSHLLPANIFNEDKRYKQHDHTLIPPASAACHCPSMTALKQDHRFRQSYLIPVSKCKVPSLTQLTTSRPVSVSTPMHLLGKTTCSPTSPVGQLSDWCSTKDV